MGRCLLGCMSVGVLVRMGQVWTQENHIALLQRSDILSDDTISLALKHQNQFDLGMIVPCAVARVALNILHDEPLVGAAD